MQVQQEEFRWTQASLAGLAVDTLARVKALGVGHAHVGLNESRGISVQVRNREISSQVAHGNQRITLSVYHEGRTAQMSSANLSSEGIARLAQAASDAVRYVERDPFAGPAEARYLAGTTANGDELALYAPLEWDIADAIAMARETEEAAFAFSPKITSSEGASCNASQMQMLVASSEGLLNGYRASTRSVSCAPVASDGSGKRIGSRSHTARSVAMLDAPAQIGGEAASYAVSQLGSRPVDTRSCAVLYDAKTATRLLGQWIAAANGMAIVTKASFLAGKIGSAVCARHLSILDDPLIPGRLASRPFDSDGIASRARALIDGGVLMGYLLSAYAARRLNMTPTGSADGPGNLELTSTTTRATDDFAAMLRALDTGFLVTGLSGGGFNGQTGEYSQGAEGFWVERGEIQYPVDNVTVAGNTGSMFGEMLAVGADRFTAGALTSGSVLIGDMRVAGR